MSKFKVGDKLTANKIDREHYGIEYVIITSINKGDNVYHWESPYLGGLIHSGYFFNDAESYE